MSYEDYEFDYSFSNYQKGRLEGYYGNRLDGKTGWVRVYHDTETDKWYLGSESTGRPTKKEIDRPTKFREFKKRPNII